MSIEKLCEGASGRVSRELMVKSQQADDSDREAAFEIAMDRAVNKRGAANDGIAERDSPAVEDRDDQCNCRNCFAR